MTKQQKSLLRKHAEHFEAMSSHVQEATPEELEELMSACLAASDTNCGWSVFEAAQYLKREVQGKINMDTRMAAVS